MSASPTNRDDVKLLPGGTGARVSEPAVPASAAAEAVVSATAPPRQLSELPKDELEHLAEEFGLDPTRFRSRQALVVGIHERRQMIAGMDREAMLDVVRWGRRPVTLNATKEQIAQEIARIPLMKFQGLSHRGLVCLGRMRGLEAREGDPVPFLIKRLRKQEGFFSRVSRKRRALLGSLVAKVIGEADGAGGEYKFLPPGAAPGGPAGPGYGSVPPPRSASMKEEIEESGLFGGITSRIKKTADQYINQKLDEIETRIDRKLDEIDRRLAEWRDKEIANRLRILKITLWASVIVGAFSLIYSYVKVYVYPDPRPADVRPERPAAPRGTLPASPGPGPGERP